MTSLRCCRSCLVCLNTEFASTACLKRRIRAFTLEKPRLSVSCDVRWLDAAGRLFVKRRHAVRVKSSLVIGCQPHVTTTTNNTSCSRSERTTSRNLYVRKACFLVPRGAALPSFPSFLFTWMFDLTVNSCRCVTPGGKYQELSLQLSPQLSVGRCWAQVGAHLDSSHSPRGSH